jgi:hypothetical protein
MRYPTRKSIFTLIAFTALATSTPLEGAKRKLLNRSIYVPVHFRLCEHLRNGILYIGEQAVAHLPTERVFQFTYYPSLQRIAPEAVDVRIDAIDQEGNPIVARLAITPKGIWTAHEHVDLDFEKHLKKLSYKIDTRYDKVDLLIRCGQSCASGGRSEEDLQTQEEESDSSKQRVGEEKREGGR